MENDYNLKEFLKSFIRFIDGISDLGMHSLQVGFASSLLAKQLKLDIVQEITTLGLVHDIGFLAPKYLRITAKWLANQKDISTRKILQIDKSSHTNIDQHINMYYHSIIGAVLLDTTLYYKFSKALYFHHTPAKFLDIKKKHHFLANIIHLADTISIEALYTIHEENGYIDINNIKKKIEKSDEFFDEIKDAFFKQFDNYINWFILTNKKALTDNLLDWDNRKISYKELAKITDIIKFIIDHKSPFTRKHTEGIVYTVNAIANELRLDKITKTKLKIAADLHDIGKIYTPLSILEKPSTLNNKELFEMKQHIFYSCIILNGIKYHTKYDWVRWAVNHHERLDGSGYPWGKKARSLDLQSRILQIADVFVAMVEDRPYREGMPINKVLSIIEKDVLKGKFDSDIFEILKKLVKNNFNPNIDKESNIEIILRDILTEMKAAKTLLTEYMDITQ